MPRVGRRWLGVWQVVAAVLAVPAVVVALATISVGATIATVFLGAITASVSACCRNRDHDGGIDLGKMAGHGAWGAAAGLAIRGSGLVLGGGWTLLLILLLGSTGAALAFMSRKPDRGSRHDWSNVDLRRLSERSTDQLSQLWRDSTLALRTSTAPVDRQRIALVRQHCLAEFQRRIPDGFPALAGMLLARPDADPRPYLMNASPADPPPRTTRPGTSTEETA